MFLNYFVYFFRSIEVKFVLVTQVARVFYYLSAAALQYLAPTILLLFSVLMLRTLGRFTAWPLLKELWLWPQEILYRCQRILTWTLSKNEFNCIKILFGKKKYCFSVGVWLGFDFITFASAPCQYSLSFAFSNLTYSRKTQHESSEIFFEHASFMIIMAHYCLEYHRPIITNACPPKRPQKSLRAKLVPILPGV